MSNQKKSTESLNRTSVATISRPSTFVSTCTRIDPPARPVVQRLLRTNKARNGRLQLQAWTDLTNEAWRFAGGMRFDVDNPSPPPVVSNVNGITLDTMRTSGGCAETLVYWTPFPHSEIDYGIDHSITPIADPTPAAAGRARYSTAQASHLWDRNQSLYVGFEAAWRETEYRSLPLNNRLFLFRIPMGVLERCGPAHPASGQHPSRNLPCTLHVARRVITTATEFQSGSRCLRGVRVSCPSVRPLEKSRGRTLMLLGTCCSIPTTTGFQTQKTTPWLCTVPQ